MTTEQTASTLLAAVAASLVGATAALMITTASPAPTPPPASLQERGDDGFELGFTGNAGRVPDSKKPRVTAWFTRESYRPGDVARLRVSDTAPDVAVQLFRAGGESRMTIAGDVMYGTAVSEPVAAGGRSSLSVRIGSWPSGVYFARLTSGDRVGYAPFVLAPKRLGEHRVAVVMPTMTWQAYNWRDDDRDGLGDTWYAGWRTNQARLIRPFLNRGVPPHWKHYDAPFVRWLTATGREVDYLSDAQLRAVPDGRALAAAYTLIVFSGHHEYVTTHEYDVVTRYRDLGGNLMFLSANNFFWRVDLRGTVMTRVAQWRDLGRPEAALIGVQYRANDDGSHRGGWHVRRTTPWLGLRAGTTIGDGGIEIDKTAPSSPRNVRILAEIPNLYGTGFTAQMTYYETPAGAKVFAAGAFTLAGEVWQPEMRQVVAKLWARLSVS